MTRKRVTRKKDKNLPGQFNEHSENIFSISWSDLSAKTFLFERIAVRTIWYSFERLWLSVPKKECHPFEWLEPSFHKKCHLFERLVLSVRTAWAIRLKKNCYPFENEIVDRSSD